MTENKRSRQWVLKRKGEELHANYGPYNWFVGPKEEVHVIEYSEVKKLEWKDKILGEQLAAAESTIKELEDKLETMTNVNKNLCATNLELHSEIDKLETELVDSKEHVEHFADKVKEAYNIIIPNLESKLKVLEEKLQYHDKIVDHNIDLHVKINELNYNNNKLKSLFSVQLDVMEQNKSLSKALEKCKEQRNSWVGSCDIMDNDKYAIEKEIKIMDLEISDILNTQEDSK